MVNLFITSKRLCNLGNSIQIWFCMLFASLVLYFPLPQDNYVPTMFFFSLLSNSSNICATIRQTIYLYFILLVDYGCKPKPTELSGVYFRIDMHGIAA